MSAIVGVFKSRLDAERCAGELRADGYPKNLIFILTPDMKKEELLKVPHTEGEQPGMVETIGAVAGGAVGMGVGETLASLLIPGVGPILALGIGSGALLGALAGGTLGKFAENGVFPGITNDELYIYKEALRQGRSVLVIMAEDKKKAEAVRAILTRCGAESIDRAREMWWLGLRDVEKEHYEAHGGNFEQDERPFRLGFEAAFQDYSRGKNYEQCRADLGKHYPEVYESDAFQRGFQRGQAIREKTEEQEPRVQKKKAAF